MDFWIFVFQNLRYWLTFIHNNYFYHWNYSYFYIQNMDEITLTEAGWAWKVKNFTFLPFLAAQNSSHTQTCKYCHGLNFHCNLIFFNARINVLYQNQHQLKFPKIANYCLKFKSMIPLTLLTSQFFCTVFLQAGVKHPTDERWIIWRICRG